MDLTGKTALVTGGNSGIGLATAKLFVAHGARVAITGRDPATLAQAQAALGADALVLQSDMREQDEITRLVASVKARFGTLDILFANASVAQVGMFAQVSEARIAAPSSLPITSGRMPSGSRAPISFLLVSATNE